jgi:hypothetical protein
VFTRRTYELRPGVVLAARLGRRGEVITEPGVGLKTLDGAEWVVEVADTPWVVVLPDTVFRTVFQPVNGDVPDGWQQLDLDTPDN